MKTIRIVYLLLVFLLFSLPGTGQGLFNSGAARGSGMLSGKLPENTRFNLEFGTGFTSFSSGGSMLGNYVAPRLEYDVNPSLTIIAGGSFSFNQYNNLPGQSLVVNNQSSLMQRGMTDHSLFVSGRYSINENLYMTGTIYREEGHLPILLMNRSTMNPGAMDYKNHGMSMGFNYRISNNLHFGAEVGVRRSNSPYGSYSPFSDPFSSRQRSRYHSFPY